MIKIRYRGLSELSPGLHAAAERHGRHTTVYLVCGLTVAQRRAALPRLRLSARTGRSPRLPAAQLGFALCAARIRAAAGLATAIVRAHPAGSMVPVMMVSGAATAFLALSPVPSGPQPPGQPPTLSVTPTAMPPAIMSENHRGRHCHHRWVPPPSVRANLRL